MANNPKYYIIESSALPEVFLKVAEAKRLLDTGEAATVSGFHSPLPEPDGRPDHHISADAPR